MDEHTRCRGVRDKQSDEFFAVEIQAVCMRLDGMNAFLKNAPLQKRMHVAFRLGPNNKFPP